MQMYSLHINNNVLYCLTHLTTTLPSAVYTFQCHSFSVDTKKNNGIKEKSFITKKTTTKTLKESVFNTTGYRPTKTSDLQHCLYSKMKGQQAECQLQLSLGATSGLVVSILGITSNEFLPLLPTVYNFQGICYCIFQIICNDCSENCQALFLKQVDRYECVSNGEDMCTVPWKMALFGHRKFSFHTHTHTHHTTTHTQSYMFIP